MKREEILEIQVGRSTRKSKYVEYLVKWRGRPIEDSSSWISKARFNHLVFPLTLEK
jgi:hypothetical protein